MSATAASQLIDGSAIASAVRAEIAGAVAALKEKHGKVRHAADAPLPARRARSCARRRCLGWLW